MSEAPDPKAATTNPEAYENDFRPVKDAPSEDFLANLPPEAKALYDASMKGDQ